VAGTIEIALLKLRCRTMPRDATNYAGGHTSALGELFIADESRKTQGEIYLFDSWVRHA